MTIRIVLNSVPGSIVPRCNVHSYSCKSRSRLSQSVGHNGTVKYRIEIDIVPVQHG